MAYFKKTTKAGKTIDIHNSFTKREGKPKKKENSRVTPEQIEKVNIRNATIKLTRLLNANFQDGDYHIILTYRKNNRPLPEEAKEQISKFFKDVRKKYNKQSIELKYIYATEYENTAIHHHVIINNFDRANVSDIIREAWKYGKVMFTPLYSEGQYKDLAEYLIKETAKTFRKADGGNKQRYSCSRNLVRPVTKIKIVKGKCWMPEPKPPKGYYVDMETLHNGINPFTGRPYQRYTLIEIPKGGCSQIKLLNLEEWGEGYE